jgi:hypothetical protein
VTFTLRYTTFCSSIVSVVAVTHGPNKVGCLKLLRQYCESGMVILDPGSGFFPSRIPEVNVWVSISGELSVLYKINAWPYITRKEAFFQIKSIFNKTALYIQYTEYICVTITLSAEVIRWSLVFDHSSVFSVSFMTKLSSLVLFLCNNVLYGKIYKGNILNANRPV